jgi:glucan 1,3-beta-glucosidase
MSNSFFSRKSDITQSTLLKQQGFNHLRVPIGFWALIPLANGEPYVSTGQLDQLEKLAGWAYDNQMYIMLDLHGMPGSQNGLQQSGHNTSDIQFWNQQDRADATIQAAINHIHNSTYRSVYTSLAICNEPVRSAFGLWI